MKTVLIARTGKFLDDVIVELGRKRIKFEIVGSYTEILDMTSSKNGPKLKVILLDGNLEGGLNACAKINESRRQIPFWYFGDVPRAELPSYFTATYPQNGYNAKNIVSEIDKL